MATAQEREPSDPSARIPWRRLMPALLALGVAGYFLYAARSTLPPFVIAFAVASLLDPIVSRIQARGVSRARAVLSIFALAFLAIVLAGILIVPTTVAQISDLAQNIETYSTSVGEQFRSITARADHWYENRRDTLAQLGMDDKPSAFFSKQSGPIGSAVRNILDSLKNTIAGFLGQVLWLVIIPLSLFWFLLEYPVIRARLTAFLPPHKRADVDRMMREIVEIFSAYVRGLAKVCLYYGAAATLLFWIMRLRYGLFLGVAAGVFYAVPYVGPALAIAAITVIALTMGNGVGFVVLVVCLFIVMHVAFDYGVTPRVIGGSVGLHPLVNIFALMCGATLFGVWGMILAVPVAASIQKLFVYLFPALAQPPGAIDSPPAPGEPAS